MGELSIWHWLIVLLVVALIFGTRKLRNIGSDLGGAVKGFIPMTNLPGRSSKAARIAQERKRTAKRPAFKPARRM